MSKYPLFAGTRVLSEEGFTFARLLLQRPFPQRVLPSEGLGWDFIMTLCSRVHCPAAPPHLHTPSIRASTAKAVSALGLPTAVGPAGAQPAQPSKLPFTSTSLQTYTSPPSKASGPRSCCCWWLWVTERTPTLSPPSLMLTSHWFSSRALVSPTVPCKGWLFRVEKYYRGSLLTRRQLQRGIL